MSDCVIVVKFADFKKCPLRKYFYSFAKDSKKNYVYVWKLQTCTNAIMKCNESYIFKIAPTTESL